MAIKVIKRYGFAFSILDEVNYNEGTDEKVSLGKQVKE